MDRHDQEHDVTPHGVTRASKESLSTESGCKQQAAGNVNVPETLSELKRAIDGSTPMKEAEARPASYGKGGRRFGLRSRGSSPGKPSGSRGLPPSEPF